MPKNIIIFSDGTGQAGGITFDEARTNVYKLYRACRVGPDSQVDPNEQVAFYDPGVGSASDGGHLHSRTAQWLFDLASQATGLGITRNIVDCYAALIRLYRDGDRIFLIGFSRGAYTVRSLAGALAFCGIPRRMPDGSPLPMDVAGSTALAKRAVRDVYQFCSSYRRDKIRRYLTFMMDTREAIAVQFREQHGCEVPTADGRTQANVFPYFIGVFDTVAALGHKGLGLLVSALVLAAPFLISFVISLLSFLNELPFVGWIFAYLHFWPVFEVVAPVLIFIAVLVTLKNYLKWAPPVPGYNWLWRLATVHFTQPKHKFYDTTLNVNVVYAKHAISIDENRADFARVPWSPTAEKLNKRDPENNLYFEQVWFSGVHADVGGGYPENESRLSDVALGWMLAAASIIPNGIKHDPSVLKISPDPGGPQHDEQARSFFKLGSRELPADSKTKVSAATMHKSVYRRFEADEVLLFNKMGIYHPKNLSDHIDFLQYFNGTQNPQPAPSPTCVADDIESKWRDRTAAQ